MITAGAQEGLWLLSHVLRPHSGSLVTSCPTYPGLASALASTRRHIVAAGADTAGPDTRLEISGDTSVLRRVLPEPVAASA